MGVSLLIFAVRNVDIDGFSRFLCNVDTRYGYHAMSRPDYHRQAPQDLARHCAYSLVCVPRVFVLPGAL